MGTVELALLIMTGLAEAAKLGRELYARAERGEMTPEEAAEQWQRVSADWRAANDAWVNARAPGQGE